MLTEEEIEGRKSLWQDLAELWKDTELFDYELSYIAGRMRLSIFSLNEIEKILSEEVAPAVYGNLLWFGGSWTGFDAEWLHEDILENLRKQECNLLYRAWVKSGAGKFIRMRMVRNEWLKIVQLYEEGDSKNS